jgi:hypothetical protein
MSIQTTPQAEAEAAAMLEGSKADLVAEIMALRELRDSTANPLQWRYSTDRLTVSMLVNGRVVFSRNGDDLKIMVTRWASALPQLRAILDQAASADQVKAKRDADNERKANVNAARRTNQPQY